MNYTLLIYETADQFKLLDDPDYMAGWPAYAQALTEAGVMRGGAGLMPPATATTVRFEAQGHIIEDGPYAETQEMLGGFFNIEVTSLDEALKWAARMPVRPGARVEVRPQLSM